jgi:hypothetical protein
VQEDKFVGRLTGATVIVQPLEPKSSQKFDKELSIAYRLKLQHTPSLTCLSLFILKMARTKKWPVPLTCFSLFILKMARKSTGGKAPCKQLATKAARKTLTPAV